MRLHSLSLPCAFETIPIALAARWMVFSFKWTLAPASTTSCRVRGPFARRSVRYPFACSMASGFGPGFSGASSVVEVCSEMPPHRTIPESPGPAAME